MKPSDNGRRQHEELQAAAVELETHAARADCDPVLLRRQLARFGGRLLVHATMEEEALYPRLLESGNPTLAALAQRLHDDVADVYVVVAEFVTRYTLDRAIGDVAAFRTELAVVLERLRTRLTLENEQLYPAADSLL